MNKKTWQMQLIIGERKRNIHTLKDDFFSPQIKECTLYKYPLDFYKKLVSPLIKGGSRHRNKMRVLSCLIYFLHIRRLLAYIAP